MQGEYKKVGKQAFQALRQLAKQLQHMKIARTRNDIKRYETPQIGLEIKNPTKNKKKLPEERHKNQMEKKPQFWQINTRTAERETAPHFR